MCMCSCHARTQEGKKEGGVVFVCVCFASEVIVIDGSCMKGVVWYL